MIYINATHDLVKRVHDVRQKLAQEGDVDGFEAIDTISCSDVYGIVTQAYAAWGDRSRKEPYGYARDMVEALIQIKLNEGED